MNSKINSLELSNGSLCKEVSVKDIEKVINDKVGMPIYDIRGDNVRNIINISKILRNKFVGQDEVIDSLINTVKRIRLGYSNYKVMSYLFVGPSGVGKTGIAKEFAKEFFGKDNLIRLDMSEYSDGMGVNKIIGSAPGYVGYQDQYTIFSRLKEKPNSVILLDEIDKAHPSVLNLMYQMLDDGKISDSRNNTVYLNHSIIIMTSNLGFDGDRVGFCSDKKFDVNSILKEKFSLSLINRISHVLVFNYLKEEDMVRIVKMRLDELKKKYSGFKYSKSLVRDIVLESNYKVYGARRVDVIIENKLENFIIDRLIEKKDISIKHLEGTL